MGDWSVHQAENTLSSGGRTLHLEPRVMDVLVYLAAEAERVVPKEELLEAVWGGAYIEEGALSQAVHSLRKTLGDDARQPQYIQTIPKRGYRLVAPLMPEESRTSSTGIHAVAPPQRDLMASSPALVTVAPPVPVRLPRRSRILMAAGVVLVAVVLWFAWAKLRPMSEATRIVVLPFENMGGPEDDYFADGLTEEITKDLASLHSLEVISRTTAILYEGAKKPLPEIGRELGVHYVLEGTVRWALGPGGRRIARITPQLIRVADDTHVWAESFDREVKDIFKVQAEISQKVIRALGIKLLPQEEKKDSPPTANLEAYSAYVRGLQLKNQPFYSDESLRKAVSMFEHAVNLDSKFAVAWAELSQTHSYLAFNTDPSPVRVEKARQTLGEALALAPELPEVRVAQAYFTYRCLEDYDTALKQLSATAELFPNDTGVLETLGFLLRRKGRLADAIQTLKNASDLSPRSTNLMWAIAETYRAMRDFDQAGHFFGRAISLAPDEAFFWHEQALNLIAWKGDIGGARALLEKAPDSVQSDLRSVLGFQLNFYEHKYEQALAQLSSDWTRNLPPQGQNHIAMQLAIAKERLGDRQAALDGIEENRARLEAQVKQFPKDPMFRAYLAVALAQLGRETEALSQAERAVQQKRHDSFSGPLLVEVQAMVDTILGRHREAIDRLAHLLAVPYRSSMTIARLRLDPIWDPLRHEQAFQHLLRDSEVDKSE